MKETEIQLEQRRKRQEEINSRRAEQKVKEEIMKIKQAKRDAEKPVTGKPKKIEQITKLQ